MPSPTSISPTTTVSLSNSQNIDALLGVSKWGGVVGTGAILSYSFPWASGGNATFSGLNGVGNYSTPSEYTATSHYALDATQQTAARDALQSWSNVANVNFQEVADTATNVGDIRFAWTSATFMSATGGQAWGWTILPTPYWPAGADIWISTLTATDTDWSKSKYNYSALVHEIGHSLGLKHPFEAPVLLPALLDTTLHSVMSYTSSLSDLARDMRESHC